MLNLTKEQRNAVYKLALHSYQTHDLEGSPFLCDQIAAAVESIGHDDSYSFKDVVNDFPEFSAMRPSKIPYPGWWLAKLKKVRIDCLKQCIKETE